MPREYILTTEIKPTAEEAVTIQTYMEARATAKAAQAQAEKLEAQTLELIHKYGPMQHNCSYVALGSYTRYTYPENVQRLEAKLKQAQTEAKEAGLAKPVVTVNLQFKLLPAMVLPQD